MKVSPTGSRRSRLTLRVDERLWKRLRKFHLSAGKRHESLSYLWARCERVRDGYVVLLPDDSPFFPFGSDCLERQSGSQVRLRPDVLNGMLVRFAGSEYNCLVNVHDHWFSEHAQFSAVDDADDLEFDRYLRKRFEPMLKRHPEIGSARRIHNLSVVLGQSAASARLTDVRRSKPLLFAERISLIGERLELVPLAGMAASGVTRDTLERQRGFLAEKVQQELTDWHVAIVGCGGLGSVLGESLARVGVRRFTLIDGDRLEATNLNRWQGATPDDVGAPKARLLARRMRAMFPDAEIHAVTHALDHPRSVLAIAAADAIVGGVDNDEARWLLNHVAVQYLQPYFDAGVVIEPLPAVDFVGRFFAVLPGLTGCVDCKSYTLIDRNAVVLAFANAAVAAERRAAGYVRGTPSAPAPSAYALNQRTAALAVQEILNYAAGWRPLATVLRESWSTARLERADRVNYAEAPWSCCPVCSLRIGRGSSIPLPKRACGVVKTLLPVSEAAEPTQI